MSYFGATGKPGFGFLVTSPLGFKPEWVLLIHFFAEANVMYISLAEYYFVFHFV